eukprot:12217367-Alexandrium_andersonii.AAC.1
MGLRAASRPQRGPSPPLLGQVDVPNRGLQAPALWLRPLLEMADNSKRIGQRCADDPRCAPEAAAAE